jgi:C4-dicarboxylate-specific signal transduction histidine kinase
MSARILLPLYAFLLLAVHALAQGVIQARVVADLVSSLRAFAHPNPTQFDSINLLECVRQACRFSFGSHEPRTCRAIRIDAGLVIKGNPTQISQLFINLIQNAYDACNSHEYSGCIPAITIDAVVEEEQVTITIEDNGIRHSKRGYGQDI